MVTTPAFADASPQVPRPRSIADLDAAVVTDTAREVRRHLGEALDDVALPA